LEALWILIQLTYTDDGSAELVLLSRQILAQFDLQMAQIQDINKDVTFN